MNPDSYFWKWVYLISHVLTLVSLFAAFFISLSKKMKSKLWFQVSYFFDYFIRILLIIAALAIVGMGWIYVFNGIWSPYGYWDGRYFGGYIITYVVSAIIIVVILRLAIIVISTSKFDLIRTVIKLLPNSQIILDRYLPKLHVDRAEYGINQNQIDITDSINAMIKNNTLTVSSGNHLVPYDPLPGDGKYLTLTYTFAGKSSWAIIPEGTTRTIPS